MCQKNGPAFPTGLVPAAPDPRLPYQSSGRPHFVRLSNGQLMRVEGFWVEDGEIRAPLNVMRFDDTAYRMLGDQLEALTAERDLVVDSDTYGERSTLSLRTPGALLKEFMLTL